MLLYGASFAGHNVFCVRALCATLKEFKYELVAHSKDCVMCANANVAETEWKELYRSELKCNETKPRASASASECRQNDSANMRCIDFVLIANGCQPKCMQTVKCHIVVQFTISTVHSFPLFSPLLRHSPWIEVIVSFHGYFIKIFSRNIATKTILCYPPRCDGHHIRFSRFPIERFSALTANVERGASFDHNSK